MDENERENERDRWIGEEFVDHVSLSSISSNV